MSKDKQNNKQAAEPSDGKTNETGVAGAVKPRKRKLRGWQTALIVVGSIVLVLAVVLFIFFQYVTNTISGEETEAGVLPQEVKTEELPEYTGKGIINILVCGIDYDLDEDGKPVGDQVGRTDLILYLMYDTQNNKVNLLQIPRDVYVGDDLPTRDEQGVNTGKINGLYYDAPDPNNRMAPLTRVLKDQLGLPTDYYVTIDMEALKEIINIKGSIEVYVPVEVNDPETGSVIEPGMRYFSGDEAEFYLRNRKSTTYGGQGDIMRLQMQQNFYSALFREFKSLSPWDLVMWMRVLLHRCDTDMDTMQLGGLAQKALSIQGEDITFVRPPVGGAVYNGRDMQYLVPEETAELLNQYFRPDGHTVDVEDLDIHTLPFDEKFGIHAASVRTMSSIQMSEMQGAAKVEQSASQSTAESATGEASAAA